MIVCRHIRKRTHYFHCFQFITLLCYVCVAAVDAAAAVTITTADAGLCHCRQRHQRPCLSVALFCTSPYLMLATNSLLFSLTLCTLLWSFHFIIIIIMLMVLVVVLTKVEWPLTRGHSTAPGKAVIDFFFLNSPWVWLRLQLLWITKDVDNGC